VKLKIGSGLAVTLLVAGFGMAVPQTLSKDTDEQTIRKLDKDWSTAVQKKDSAKTLSYYADGASVFPFNAPIATGKEQLLKLWTGLMAMPGFSLSFAPAKIEIAKSGDMAYDIGTFELKTTDAKGNPNVAIGKYVVVWKKQSDKQWKVVADIFNTDK
jgi:ketosteroid isomerase-like protein